MLPRCTEPGTSNYHSVGEDDFYIKNTLNAGSGVEVKVNVKTKLIFIFHTNFQMT
jgi:hypothetical protein